MKNIRSRFTEVKFTHPDGGECKLRARNKTLVEVIALAIEFGYVPPKWFAPWQYFTNKLYITQTHNNDGIN